MFAGFDWLKMGFRGGHLQAQYCLLGQQNILYIQQLRASKSLKKESNQRRQFISHVERMYLCGRQHERELSGWYTDILNIRPMNICVFVYAKL